MPYGYRLVEGQKEDAGELVYENKYMLPFAYTYPAYQTMKQFEQYTALQRQESMLSGVVLEEETDWCGQAEISFKEQKLEYEIICNSKDVTLQGNSFVATADNVSVTLAFSGPGKAGTYFYMTGLNFKETKYRDLYSDDIQADPSELYRRSGGREEGWIWDQGSIYLN